MTRKGIPETERECMETREREKREHPEGRRAVQYGWNVRADREVIGEKSEKGDWPWALHARLQKQDPRWQRPRRS